MNAIASVCLFARARAHLRTKPKKIVRKALWIQIQYLCVILFETNAFKKQWGSKSYHQNLYFRFGYALLPIRWVLYTVFATQVCKVNHRKYKHKLGFESSNVMIYCNKD